MKRLFPIALVIIIICLLFPVEAFADITLVPEDSGIVSMSTVEEIERLFTLRDALSCSYDENEEQIEEIDYKLSKLGVVEQSINYINQKMLAYNGTYKAEPPASYGGIKWSSYRFTHCVNGTLFELQVFTGVPSNSSSVLISNNIYYKTNKKLNIKPVFDLAYSISTNIAGQIPVISDIVSGADLANAALLFAYNITPKPTYVKDVDIAATVALTTRLSQVYVKYAGSSDSTQRCVYMGNTCSCDSSFTVFFGKMQPDGSCTASFLNGSINTNVVKSKSFNDYNTICWNYHLFRQYGTTFEPDQFLRFFDLSYKKTKGESSYSIVTFNVSVPLY